MHYLFPDRKINSESITKLFDQKYLSLLGIIRALTKIILNLAIFIDFNHPRESDFITTRYMTFDPDFINILIVLWVLKILKSNHLKIIGN